VPFSLLADIWQPLYAPGIAPPARIVLRLVNAAKAALEPRTFIQGYTQYEKGRNISFLELIILA
jgi:hypothetical protein